MALHNLLVASQAAAWLVAIANLFAIYALFVTMGRAHRIRSRRDLALITEDGPELHQPLRAAIVEALDLTPADADRSAWNATLILFVSPTCSPCKALGGAVRQMHRRLTKCPRVVVVVESTRADARRYCGARSRCAVRPDPEATLRAALGIVRTPFGLLTDTEGIVRMKGVVNNADQLDSLVRGRGRPIGGLRWIDADRASGDDLTRLKEVTDGQA